MTSIAESVAFGVRKRIKSGNNLIYGLFTKKNILLFVDF
jgi:hypothetical protein